MREQKELIQLNFCPLIDLNDVSTSNCNIYRQKLLHKHPCMSSVCNLGSCSADLPREQLLSVTIH